MPRIARSITRWSEKEIAPFLKKATYIHRQAGLSIRIAPSTQAIGRALIIIPAKAGNSPQRNLVRRQIKALFYERQIYTQPYDWVFYINKATILSFPLLNEALTTCLAKLSPASSSL